MQLQLIQINGETVLPITFYGKNRNLEVLEWQKKVFQSFNFPINYVEWPFHLSGHGDAGQYLVDLTINYNVDYYFFIDFDAIATRRDFLQIVYNKICDQKTIFGAAWTSNHKSPSWIYAGGCFVAFSRKLYIELGKPPLHDRIPRSDNFEELSWVAAEKGYNLSLVYPKSFFSLTDEEILKTGAPKFWQLGQKFKYGLGTQYSDLLFHCGLAGVERSSEIFIDKCKEILGEKSPKISAIIPCVGYGDILEITLPKNKKHFDEFIIVTDIKDLKTKQVCYDNNIKCIQTDAFYNNGAIFNKGAAMNVAYKNLQHRDWCLNLDADIILPDNFRYAFFAHDLNKDELYGTPRKFLWNNDQYKLWDKNENLGEELLTLDGIGVGYFQAFNFKAKCLINLDVGSLQKNSNTAEQVDIEFLYKWYPPPHPQVPRLFFDVIHLGPPGVFNNKRTNSKIPEIKSLGFKELYNLSQHEIFNEYPDISNYKNRKEQGYNQYYKYFKNSINHRDFVFRMCLDEFAKMNKPINILEIGTSRSYDGKAGDGWSTLFWCEYIEKYGGKLLVCDVDPEAISVSKTLTSDYYGKIDITFLCEDGLKHIDNSYDLIFLDGSDCPNQMLEQFEKVDRKTTKILCDDFHVKGKIVRKRYKDFKLIKVNDIHEMSIYYKI